jgi:threonylcarbamoyladenosine tRNA methylthiotransferase MtaB
VVTGEALPVAATAPRTAAITNLGCKVNQAEMEAAARLLRERGVRLVDAGSPADLHLVNTCTVTATADQKSRQAVRRARRRSPDAAIVVAGCSAQVDPGAFRTADPGARVLGNDGKAGLLAELAALTRVAGEDAGGSLAAPLPTLAGPEAVAASTLPGVADDRSAADRTRAFVKVQDGCSFFCTYCLIPAARGPERSLPPDDVLTDVRRALAAGHREIVLTGINVGTYDGGWSERGPRGSHRRRALGLAGLVRRILAETEVERIRLSSIEPQHVDDDLLATWTGPGAGRCLPHLHLPLQSGDDGVLRRMGRRYDTARYAAIVDRIRVAIPGVAVHADVIVGFPTEDAAAFERSVAFVRSIGFAGLHVFRYSARPGTPAIRMAGQVAEAEKQHRSNALLALAAEARAARAASRVGNWAEVLFESGLGDGRWLGHAQDHVLVAAAPPDGRADLANAIAEVELTAVDRELADRLVGRVRSIRVPGRPDRRALPVLDPAPAAASLGGGHGA